MSQGHASCAKVFVWHLYLLQPDPNAYLCVTKMTGRCPTPAAMSLFSSCPTVPCSGMDSACQHHACLSRTTATVYYLNLAQVCATESQSARSASTYLVQASIDCFASLFEPRSRNMHKQRFRHCKFMALNKVHTYQLFEQMKKCLGHSFLC